MEYSYTESDTRVVVLNGAVTARQISHPDRSFAIEATLDLVKGAEFFKQKPPMHFHINQEEYIEVLEGRLGVEMDGREHLVSPGDERVVIPPWANHRSYPLAPEQQRGSTVVRFILSGQKTSATFELTPVFFENWYRYQDELLVHGARVELLQVLSTFDAAGTYLSPPTVYIPFGRTLSRWIGVAFGRWLGGLLGYQPFYQKWTSDWELACIKMQSSFFQKRFATHAKST